MLCGFIIYIFDLREYLYPKCKEDLSLAFLSKIVYYFYHSFIGVLVGINLLILLFFMNAITNFHSGNQSFSFSLIYFIDILANIITHVPTLYIFLVIISHIAGIFLSLYYIYFLLTLSRGFSVLYKAKITSFYINDLPYIYIKTECGDVSGQLKNAEGKSLIILNDSDVIKAIPWNQIKVMEIKNKEEIAK